MYVLPYLRIVDSLLSFSLKRSGGKFHVCSSLLKNCRKSSFLFFEMERGKVSCMFFLT